MSTTNRNIVAIYLTFALQSLGQSIGWQFGTYFLQNELGVLNYVILTVIWSIPTFVSIVAVSYWGSASDKKGKRKPFMILGFAGFSVTYLLLSFVRSDVEFLLISAVGALFYSSSIPAGQALATTSTEKKGERLGYMIVAQSAGWFVGSLGSGFLYDIIGMFALYQISAVSCVLATLICLVFVEDVDFKPVLIGKRKSALSLLKMPGMTRLVTAVMLSALGIATISSLVAIMIVDELGGFPAYVGLANSGATLLAVIITGYIGKLIDKKGPSEILVIAYISYILFAIAYAIVPDAIGASILFAIPIYPLANTAAFAFAALLSGDEERGSAMGLINGAGNAGVAIGPIIGGIFAEYVFFRVQPVSWINMLFNLVALIIALSLLPIAKTLRKGAQHSEGDITLIEPDD
ncbi:MAG: MFS transporter [Candidatus Thorarchaeota archaeon]